MEARELAENHWEYIKSVLETHGVSDREIELIEFHYVTSFVHGVKHGREDELE